MPIVWRIHFCLFFLFLPGKVEAASLQEYQNPKDFIQESFLTEVPKAKYIWIKSEVRKDVERILGHRYHQLRVRYWSKGPISTWILEEIGKEEYITFGVTINSGLVQNAKVLVYREIRGGEIVRKAFTHQFLNSKINSKHKLNVRIHGISGATLSVRAMTKIVRMALYLDQVIQKKS